MAQGHSQKRFPYAGAVYPTVVKTAYDIGTSVIYIGYATLGTATSDALWQIKRITLVSGVPTFTEWSSQTAIFDNRTTEAYT